MLENKPEQLKFFDFPKDKNNRKFSAKYFIKKLQNGEKLSRNWLLYSMSKNSVFCYNCKLYLNATTSVPLVQDGFNNWQHLMRHL